MATGGKPIIEVKGVSKRYRLGTIGRTRLRDELERLRLWMKGGVQHRPNREFWALQDVSFAVQPGEVVGIVGRNGAGKSTMLKILSEITEPTKGEIWLRGRVASLLEVGTGFHPDLTGRDNIFLNGAILGMRKSEIVRKFDEIVAFAEIEQFVDTPVKRYSSGMYVRLAFAVAAHLEPEILIVDEVLAVGDSAFQKKCIEKMEGVSKEGRTVLFVSHNMVAVRALCSRAVLLDHGRLIADGEVNGVVDRYLTVANEAQGRIEWNDPASAPGDEFVRLKSVSVSCAGMASGKVDIEKEFRIALEYWVLRKNCRILAAVHLHNLRGELIVATGNLGSLSAQPDPWAERLYPAGIFRSSCLFPGRLFNDGAYSVTVFLNDTSATRHRVFVRDAVSFEIVDTGFMRQEYQGPWPGALRLRLPWTTEPAP